MKKWLVIGCLGVGALVLLAVSALAWFFFSSRGRLLRTEMACNGGSAAECRMAAEAHRLRGAGGKAVGFERQACTAGSDDACSDLAVSAVFGDALALNPDAAGAFLEQACDSGALRRRLDPPLGILACRRAGTALASGAGLAKSPARSAELLDTACGDGDAYSCGALAGQGATAPERRRQSSEMACHPKPPSNLIPLILQVEAAGWTLNGTRGTEEDVASRLRDVFSVRKERTVRIFWSREISPESPLDLARIADAATEVRAAGAETVLVLGPYEEYEASVAASCAALGEVWEGFAPPPPPPPPPPGN